MPREVSTDPKNARERLRRSGGRTQRDIAILANARKPIEEWDLEELARGRCRDKNGTFRGAPPVWITLAVQQEAKRRFKTLAAEELGAKVGHAIKVVVDLMDSDEIDEDGRPIVDARTKLDAAKFVIDHTLGKAKTRVDVDTGDNLKAMLAGALVMPDGKGGYVQAHPVIDGTFTEGDEGDDDLDE